MLKIGCLPWLVVAADLHNTGNVRELIFFSHPNTSSRTYHVVIPLFLSFKIARVRRLVHMPLNSKDNGSRPLSSLEIHGKQSFFLFPNIVIHETPPDRLHPTASL